MLQTDIIMQKKAKKYKTNSILKAEAEMFSTLKMQILTQAYLFENNKNQLCAV